MKKNLFAFLLISAFIGLNQNIHAKIVKFSVNMKGQTINASGIHISGDFQTLAGFPGGDWNSATAKLTARADNPDIYEITVSIPAFRKYEYKFVNGELFYEVEIVPEESRVGHEFVDNRWVYIDSLNADTTFIGPLVFGGNAPEGKKMVRFKVGTNGLNIDGNGIHVAGSFNSNDFTQARMYSFTQTAYEYMAYVDSGSTITYKYANGNTESKAETIVGTCATSGFRQVLVNADLVLDSICFATCELCATTGLKQEILAINLQVYPNPTQQNFAISFNNRASLSYEIYTFMGMSIARGNAKPNTENTISLEGMPAGIYFLKIGEETHKIVLQ